MAMRTLLWSVVAMSMFALPVCAAQENRESEGSLPNETAVLLMSENEQVGCFHAFRAEDIASLATVSPNSMSLIRDKEQIVLDLLKLLVTSDNENCVAQIIIEYLRTLPESESLYLYGSSRKAQLMALKCASRGLWMR